jgi:hypothetical protein
MDEVPEFQQFRTVRFRTLAVREWTVCKPKAELSGKIEAYFSIICNQV